MGEWTHTELRGVASALRRGTAPSYVEDSEVLAIGQRCVRNEGFDPSAARPHDASVPAVMTPEPGDVLLNSTGTGTIGRSCVYREVTGQYMVDGHVTLIRPEADKADGRVINEIVRSTEGQQYLESHCYTGSTNQIELSRAALGRMPLTLAPIDEQRRIAEILDTIDDAIRAAKHIVVKLRLIMLGMREQYCRAGCKGTKRLSLAEIAEAIIDCPHSTPTYQDHGVLVARTMHIKDGGFLTPAASRVSEEVFTSRTSRSVPAPGDVVLTREAPVGEAFAIPKGMRICLGQRVVQIRPSPSLIGEYLVELIYSSQGRDQIRRLVVGTTNPHLNVDDIRALTFDVPPPEEQRQILRSLDSIYARTSAEEAKITKLRRLRTGLATDLLSGRVRTVPL